MKHHPSVASDVRGDPPQRPHKGLRWSLWNRILWLPDPDSTRPWATALLRCATVIFLASFSLDIVANLVAEIVIALTPAQGEYGVLLPFWWPWLALLAFLVAGVAGRRTWPGDSALLLVIMPLVVFALGFVSQHGYLVGWLAVPEAVLFVGLILRNRSTQRKAADR